MPTRDLMTVFAGEYLSDLFKRSEPNALARVERALSCSNSLLNESSIGVSRC